MCCFAIYDKHFIFPISIQHPGLLKLAHLIDVANQEEIHHKLLILNEEP